MKKQLIHAATTLAVSAMFASALHAQQNLDPDLATKILRGFQIAPVSLNMSGRDANLVGYGSYLVNAVGDCNGCHSSGPQAEFTATGNPYAGQKTKINPATYLAGGRDFGAFPDPAGPFPHVVSRNLTPDKTGMGIGGHTLAEFIQIIRTGVDMDKMHPTCKGKPDGTCLPAPFVGDLLQVMPWPIQANMTDKDLQAMYEYLSAIPCVEGGPGEPANRCAPGAVTTAVAGPKNVTVVQRQFQLDGSLSKSGDGSSLTYVWSQPQGSLPASITGGTTPTPNVQFGQGRGTYMFQLTVTDASGKSAMDTVSVNYIGN